MLVKRTEELGYASNKFGDFHLMDYRIPVPRALHTDNEHQCKTQPSVVQSERYDISFLSFTGTGCGHTYTIPKQWQLVARVKLHLAVDVQLRRYHFRGRVDLTI